MLNKKGNELISIWWFFVLGVIGVGVVVGVLIFYSSNIDVRDTEVESLYDKVSSCVVDEQGFLIEGLLEEEFDVYEKCKLNKNVFDELGDFYFEIRVFDGSSNEMRDKIIAGNPAHEDSCRLVLGTNAETENYPSCVEREKFAKYDLGTGEIKNVVIKILTASNQQGEKISN